MNEQINKDNLVIENGVLVSADKGIENVVIPDNVYGVDSNAFYNCTSIKSVTIPDSVTIIDFGAFRYCESLTSFSVSAGSANYSIQDGILFNKDKTELIQYPIGKSDKSYIIPSSVTSIGDCAFYGCKSLESVTIPNSATSIGNAAFRFCESLTSITIPDSVTHLSDYLFEGCTGLTSVTIPDSVVAISYGAFDGCTSLTDITIPASVTRIELAAFGYKGAYNNHYGKYEQKLDITIHCEKHSAAEVYAIENNLKIEIIE